MKRHRRFPLLALAALALAIAANAAIFAAVHAVLRRPLPYVDPDALPWIAETSTPGVKVRATPTAPSPETRARRPCGPPAL
jgi:hypothetical protein